MPPNGLQTCPELCNVGDPVGGGGQLRALRAPWGSRSSSPVGQVGVQPSGHIAYTV